MLAVISSALLTATFWFSTDQYMFDLISHFPVQYLVVGFVGFTFFALGRRWVWCGLSIVVIVGNLVTISPFIVVSQTESNRTEVAKLMVVNVHTSNANYPAIINLVRSEQPKIAVFLEVNQDWMDALSVLGETYPYHASVAREDNFGIALFSSVPLTDIFADPLELGQPPSIRANVELSGTEVHILATHTLPPASENNFNIRNRQLVTLAFVAKNSAKPILLLGDLNTTMWSQSFAKFIASSDLLDPRQKFGILPTWPSHMPPLFIPLDHILGSEEINFSQLYTVQIPGSDHRGVVAKIYFEANSNRSAFHSP